jgi:hypothetical protein
MSIIGNGTLGTFEGKAWAKVGSSVTLREADRPAAQYAAKQVPEAATMGRLLDSYAASRALEGTDLAGCLPEDQLTAILDAPRQPQGLRQAPEKMTRALRTAAENKATLAASVGELKAAINGGEIAPDRLGQAVHANLELWRLMNDLNESVQKGGPSDVFDDLARPVRHALRSELIEPLFELAQTFDAALRKAITDRLSAPSFFPQQIAARDGHPELFREVPRMLRDIADPEERAAPPRLCSSSGRGCTSAAMMRSRSWRACSLSCSACKPTTEAFIRSTGRS